MSVEDHNETVLSDPWLIQYLRDDLIDTLTEQTVGLSLSQQSPSTESKESATWPKHEELTGSILNQAAKRVAAETFKNVCVRHPTQNHTASQDGPNIRPDFIVAWSYNDVRGSTAVVDAKDYHSSFPREQYKKILRDMCETKATRGILVFSEDAPIGKQLRSDIEKDGKVDIVELKGDRTNAVRKVTQHIGKMIDKDFVPNDKRWETYEPHVSSGENPKEQRPNRHGENSTYSSYTTYHRFHHPKKADGTLDERFTSNWDRNKDDSPDMRVPHNKTKEAQEQHLNNDESKDMRAKEHREELIDESGHHINKDGTLDKRHKENQTDTSVDASSKTNDERSNESADMRQKENRQDMVDREGHHLNADGSPDMRCQENQKETNVSSSNESQSNTNQESTGTSNETAATIPTKSDGTADLRYTTSKDAVASGAIERDEVLTEEGGAVSIDSSAGMSEESAVADIPTKSDGTADMRFSASQDAVASEVISSDQVLGGSEMVSSDGGGAGPLKADGTPDMRFSANQ